MSAAGSDPRRIELLAAGYVLRIPRFRRERTDKSTREADTLERLRRLYKEAVSRELLAVSRKWSVARGQSSVAQAERTGRPRFEAQVAQARNN